MAPKKKSIITYRERTACQGRPPTFYSDADAVRWAVSQGAFTTLSEAQRALIQTRQQFLAYPGYSVWLGVVAKRLKG